MRPGDVMAPLTAVCLRMALVLRPPTMGLNSSVGKGAMVPMAEETAHAKRAGKLKNKPRKEREKAVGNGVGTPGGGKS